MNHCDLISAITVKLLSEIILRTYNISTAESKWNNQEDWVEKSRNKCISHFRSFENKLNYTHC
jgi:hypothetical protein